MLILILIAASDLILILINYLRKLQLPITVGDYKEGLRKYRELQDMMITGNVVHLTLLNRILN
jgi:hypothetical protein